MIKLVRLDYRLLHVSGVTITLGGVALRADHGKQSRSKSDLHGIHLDSSRSERQLCGAPVK